MEPELAFPWSETVDTWKSYYSFDDESKTAFNRFFDYNNFFDPKAKTVGIPLSLAVSKVTGRFHVVMAPHICEQLYEQMVNAIPNVQPPPLEDILAIPVTVVNSFQAFKSSDLTKACKKAKSKNQSLERLREAKRQLTLSKQLVRRPNIFVSIDIEAYERDHSILLEVGWSIYDSRTQLFLDQHYINEAYTHLSNGQFVDDERDRFVFGTSVVCSLKRALQELQKDLKWAVEREGGYILVGHGLDNDLNYLSKNDFGWPTRDGKTSTDLQKGAHQTILNTETIYGATINDIINPPSLGKTLGIVNINAWHLHNAGNDAHYTLLLLLKLTDSPVFSL